MYIQPPVLKDESLVAPWRLYARFEVPLALVGSRPAGARIKLVVGKTEVVSEELEPRVDANRIIVELDKFYDSVEWPQVVKVTTREQVYTDVTHLDIGTCTQYTTVYAFAGAGAKVCVNNVCEDTDRDNDGVVEVVYLARPGDSVTVSCTKPCTVRVWRTPCLTRLRARLVLELLDEDGETLYTLEEPVETYEAPDWRPEGVTINLPAAAWPPNYPWCGVTHEPLEWDESVFLDTVQGYSMGSIWFINKSPSSECSLKHMGIVMGGLGFGSVVIPGVVFAKDNISLTMFVKDIVSIDTPCRATLPDSIALINIGGVGGVLHLLATGTAVFPIMSTLDELGYTVADVETYAIVATEVGELSPGRYEFELRPGGGVRIEAVYAKVSIMVDGAQTEPTMVGSQSPYVMLAALDLGVHKIVIIDHPIVWRINAYNSETGEVRSECVASSGGYGYLVTKGNVKITIESEYTMSYWKLTIAKGVSVGYTLVTM